MDLRPWMLFTTIGALVVALGAPTLGAEQSQDETDIRNLETRQQDAWNHHDAKAYASLFSEDGDVVNVVGWWWRGRPEIEQKLGAAYAYVFKDSTLTITDVNVRLLSSDMAVVHVIWTMVGARSPTGNVSNVPQHGIQTQMLRKQAGTWLIVAFQNTNSVPEMPFPTKPPQ